MPDSALVPANADINATLRALGLMEENQVSDFIRARVNGSTFEIGDDVYPSNQKTKEPAFYGRLLEMPIEYQGVYLTAQEAEELDRPGIADRYCKSHYDKSVYPNQGGEYAEDGTSCRKCPINPFTKRADSPLDGGKKCGWRGDLVYRMWDDNGKGDADDRVIYLSLPTTGMIELKGMRKEPEKGYVSPLNFMQQLARLGLATFGSDNAAVSIQKAALALANGGVIAAFRIVQAKSGDGARSFPVVSLTPVAIVASEGRADIKTLPAGDTPPAARNVTPLPASDTSPDPDTIAPAPADDDLPF